MSEERLGASFAIDIQNLKTGLAQANRLIRESESEFKAAAAGMDDWTKSESGLTAKIKSLNDVTSIQREKVSALKKEYARLIDEGMDPTSKQATDLRIKINNEEAALNRNESEIRQQTEALSNLGEETEEVSEKTSKFGDIAKKAGEVAVAAFAAAGVAIVGFVKSSIESYAEYEQLVGGVETLFGDSSDTVMKYAENAYKTAGMSANEYMETVTSFSASLLQSLGGDTEKAAKYADMAVSDMSDNANKMGTDIASIQNAYGGFAKQNFTMLDNLKLGYGGTKEEMQRLLDEASKISGIEYDISSYGDIVDAIHIVQNEMGITGTTAKEASTTIGGSVNSMKASWENLKVGISDENADISSLIDTMIDSALTVFDNIAPKIETALPKITQGLKEIIPKITPILGEILPELVTTAGSLVIGMIQELPAIVGEIVAAVPEILASAFGDDSAIVKIVTGTFKWIKENGTAVSTAIAAITAAFVAYQAVLKTMAIIDTIKKATEGMTIAQAALNLVMSLNPIGLVVAAIAGLVAAFVILWNKCDGFREFWINLWEKIKDIAQVTWEAITGFFSDAWDAIKKVWSAVSGWFSDVWKGIKKTFSVVGKFFKDTFSSAWDKIVEIWKGVAEWFNNKVVQPIKDFFSPLIDFFKSVWNVIAELAEGCWNAIVIIWEGVSSWFNEKIIQPVKQFFTELWESISNAAETCWAAIVTVWTIVSTWFTENIVNPVKSLFTDLWDGITSAASAAWDAIKLVWSIVSGWFDENIIQPVKGFFDGMWDKLKNGASDAWDGIKSIFSTVADFFGEIFSNAWQKVKDVFSVGGQIFDGIKDGIVSAFTTIVNAIIRGINNVIALPFEGINAALDKISGIEIFGKQPFEGLISRISVPQIPELARGGVVNKATNAIIGEDGQEAVIPLEKNTAWMDKFADKLAGKIGSRKSVTVNQTNNYSQAHSRYEIYKTKERTAAAVRLALAGGDDD